MKNYFNGHLLAIFCAVALHGGLAAWAMQPSDPVAIPQQQVIRISMVAPSSIAQEEVEAESQPEPKSQPKEDGLVQIKKTENKKLAKKEDTEVKKASETVVTSGRQSEDSLQKNAAVTEPVFAADSLNNPPPVYPKAARASNIQGTVMLEVLVSESGNAKQVNVGKSSGSSILDNAALGTVKNWRFVPARRGGEIVEASVTVPVEFRLN